MFSAPWLAWFVLIVAATRPAAAAEPPEPAGIERFVAVDNVCAWPNLTRLADGTLVATIFNRPSHGLESGDAECWSSRDGRFWELAGNPTAHDPETIRMNLAAGLAANGDLLVLCSGWSNVQQPGQEKKAPFRDAVLSAWVSRSSDGGRTWQVRKEFPANPVEGMAPLIPFGDIFQAQDGSLRASAYAAKLPERHYHTWMLRSDDDGQTWSVMSLVSDYANETHLFPLGEGKWLAAARSTQLDLFRSDDDGRTWTKQGSVTERNEFNGHLARLADGRLLLSYGVRIDGQHGVKARLSDDDGLTWGEPLRIAHALDRDCGYPSSIELAPGKILTAYYARSVVNHNRYHMGVALWDAPQP